VRDKWLRIARANLDAEAEYISKDDPAAAARVVTKIHRAVENLRNFPAMGRPGRLTGTREFVASQERRTSSLIVCVRMP